MIYFLMAVAVFCADQFTKIMVRTRMIPGDSIPIIKDFFKITYINNQGAAFGSFSGERHLLTILPFIMIVVMLVALFKSNSTNRIIRSAVIMIAAGGMGNLTDRVIFGQVTDMLSFSIFPPVFNVADIAVVVGCFLVIFDVLFKEGFRKKR